MEERATQAKRLAASRCNKLMKRAPFHKFLAQKKANEESFALGDIVDLHLGKRLAKGSTALAALGLDLRLRVEDGLVESPGFILGNVATLLQALLGLGLGLLGGGLVDVAAI